MTVYSFMYIFNVSAKVYLHFLYRLVSDVSSFDIDNFALKLIVPYRKLLLYQLSLNPFDTKINMSFLSPSQVWIHHNLCQTLKKKLAFRIFRTLF